MLSASAGGYSVPTENENDNYRSVVADLKSLIRHVQASIALVETAIARESSEGNQDAAADIFVLDDVTPAYEKAHAALKASGADLDAALQFILDAKNWMPEVLDANNARRQRE
jgi:hypothetical protein